jgi:N-acetyl-S-(2-succino)cysteine monooxygenase
MSRRTGELKLGAFLYPTGHHIAAWRHPLAQADAGSNFAHYAELARIAEAAKFDLIFMADGVGTRGTDSEALSRTAIRYVAQFEPLTLLSALAALTERVGFVATASTTYNEPYHIARKFASLDHISGGRAGWNLVTSASEDEAHNFNRDHHVAHAERYERAEEFADVVRGLWDTWEDDAFLRDKDSGIYYDPSKQHLLNHRGKHFKVRGPLNVARAPQGHPVIVQAGSSEPGKDLAARTAEVIFTAHQNIEDARAFYSDVKGRLGRYGRSPDDLKIMPGIFPVIGKTKSEAQEKFEQIQELIHPAVGLSLLNSMAGGRRSVKISAGWATPGSHRNQWQQEPPEADGRSCPAREPDHSPALSACRRCEGRLATRRNAGTDRRPDGGMVHHRCGRRLQRHAAASARGPYGFRRAHRA